VPRARRISNRDYARLLVVRTRLREFEHLTAAQHQLLLAVRGHSGAGGPTVGQAAEYLMIRHNTAVELVDRTQDLGLVDRARDETDHRVVRLVLTREGRSRLAALTGAHIEELARLTPMIDALTDALHQG
jgi:DNA-binding MarR family transcriptional regulator